MPQEPAVTPLEPQPAGKVLFQSHGTPPDAAEQITPPPAGEIAAPADTASHLPEGKDPVPDLSDREREAFILTRYDLELRLDPARAGLTMRARLTVRNAGVEPLRRVPLQVSSTLHWESAAEITSGGGRAPLALVQHTIDTDADHTGQANEAVLELGQALVPGSSTELDVLYSGTITPSAGRLRRLGAAADQAEAADWDRISAAGGHSTALRGFGNVLWYPVISQQVFLGNGNELFRAVGAMRRRARGTAARLRVQVEYGGEPPVAVYFCGRRQPLQARSDSSETPVAQGTGVATAEFTSSPIGFRIPSLFVVDHPEALLAPLPSGGEAPGTAEAFSSSVAASNDGAETRGRARTQKSGGVSAGDVSMLAVEGGPDEAAFAPLAASAERVAPLLMDWFGPRPLSALTVLDAGGQPFQDGPLLRASVRALGSATGAGALAHALTSAWVQTGEPWMDEGLAQFMELLWTEQTAGRAAALAQLGELLTPVSLAEPLFSRPLAESGAAGGSADSPSDAGRSSGEALIAPNSELFYRRKAAAVWWMLRDVAGEEPLRQALSAWRIQPVSVDEGGAHALAFQKLLEKTSRKDLGWFFEDWVLHDRGLPDLTLVDVTPRQLPAGQGHDSGWLVAVTVRNDGAAVAEVPLIVRSGSYSSTRRVRVPGFGSVTERILVEAPPTEVLLNDGGTPEVRTSIHTRAIVVHGS